MSWEMSGSTCQEAWVSKGVACNVQRREAGQLKPLRQAAQLTSAQRQAAQAQAGGPKGGGGGEQGQHP